MTSPTDPLYNGLPVDGLDYNLATPDVGVVVIDESGSGHVRARGRLGRGRRHRLLRRVARLQPGLPERDVHADGAGTKRLRDGLGGALAAGGGRRTVRQPGAAAERPRPTRSGCASATAPRASATSRIEFQRHKIVNGDIVDENGRALVLTFDFSNWNKPYRVYLWAVDENPALGETPASNEPAVGTEIDPRSEGDRVVVIQHSVISNNPLFDGALVRNVEATVYDNDTPGVFVTQIEKSAVCPGVDCIEDKTHGRRRGQGRPGRQRATPAPTTTS